MAGTYFVLCCFYIYIYIAKGCVLCFFVAEIGVCAWLMSFVYNWVIFNFNINFNYKNNHI